MSTTNNGQDLPNESSKCNLKTTNDLICLRLSMMMNDIQNQYLEKGKKYIREETAKCSKKLN